MLIKKIFLLVLCLMVVLPAITFAEQGIHENPRTIIITTPNISGFINPINSKNTDVRSDLILSEIQARGPPSVNSTRSVSIGNYSTNSKNDVNISSISSSAEYVQDHVIVKYRQNSVSSQSVEDVQTNANNQVGASVFMDSSILGLPDTQVVKLLTNKSVIEAINDYSNNPMVEYAEPDYITHFDEKEPVKFIPNSIFKSNNDSVQAVVPNDPYFSYQYSLKNTGQYIRYNYGTSGADISAEDAWQMTSGSPSVIIAVLDTGLDTSISDFSGKIVNQYNAYANNYDVTDYNGHGTDCAGIAGAIGNNGIGVAGVTWGCKIMPVKISDNSANAPSIPNSAVISGLSWAKSHGASIVSCSFGGPSYSISMKTAFQNFEGLAVVAAGNGGSDDVGDNNDVTPTYPASYDNTNIIAVASTDNRDTLAISSNYGPTSVDIAAPGVNIIGYGTGGESSLWWYSGTSMATPNVAGVAALVKSANPSYTAVQIKTAILNGVDVKSSLSGMCVTGGRVNAKLSLPSSTSEASNIGVFRGAGFWYLDHDGSYSWTTDDLNWIKSFGLSGDIPVAGDWNGDGKKELGVFRGNGLYGYWYLDHDGSNSWSADDLNWIKSFGLSTDLPVTGDWNGDGIDELGVFRGNGYWGNWYLDHDQSWSWSSDDLNWIKSFGISTDKPVSGDWNGDGIDELGVFRGNGYWGNWYLDHDQSWSWSSDDLNWIKSFGISTDKPVPGDWNGDGIDELGVFRGSGLYGYWYLDHDGSNSWSADDLNWIKSFGLSGDIPVVGKWSMSGMA
jgi:thermitase